MAESAGRILAIVVGDAPGLDAVRAALAACDDLEVVGAEPTVDGVAEALSTVDVDVVLLATRSRSFPVGELAEVRARTGAPVILLAPATAPELLELALELQMADALLMPQPPESVLFAIRKVAGARDDAGGGRAGRGRVFTAFSPKGGTGKSVTATNLAVALGELRQRTLLVDLDLQFGDCAVMLGLQPELTVLDLVSASGELDADKLAGYVVRHASGIDLLAAPKRPEDAELVSIQRLVGLLEVARESYDVVVVDTAPFLHGPILTALDHTDALLLLAVLDVPTLKDVRQTLETLELISFPRERIHLVLNKADAPVGMTQADVEAVFVRRFAYALPEDRHVPLSVNRSSPALVAEPRSPFADAMRGVAETLLERVRPRSVEGRVGQP